LPLFVVVSSQAAAPPPAAELAARADAGKAAMAAGLYDEAAGIYAAIVQALPNEPGMRLNLGIAHGMAGRPAEAVKQLEAALELKPDLVPAALFLGTAHLQLGQPARAVAPLEKVVAAQPDNVQARQMLADALLALERWGPASRHFKALSERAGDAPGSWYGLGRSYEGLAASAFERIARAAPESPWTLLLTGEALAAGGRHANAYRLYREALAERPGWRLAHEAIAEVYETTGHADWATVERLRAGPAAPSPCAAPAPACDFQAGRYEAVLASGRTDPEGDYWKARAAGELARDAFARLRALPASPEAALHAADALGAQGRAVEAVARLREAAEAWPRDRRLRRQLARANWLARDYAAARPLLEDLRRAEPGAADVAFLLGDTLLQQQEVAAAVPILEQAVRADPKALPARAALGRALAQAGEPARAIPHLVAAAETDADGALHYQLSRAHQATGQAELAARALERSQALRQASQARQAEAEAEFQVTPP
jgi:tetratricopeptide (TPR) repeat protein